MDHDGRRRSLEGGWLGTSPSARSRSGRGARMTQARDRDVLLALCARDLSSPAKPFAAAETWRLLKELGERGRRPGDLLEDVRVDDRVAERLGAIDQVAPLGERYAEQGLWVLTPVDGSFPKRLEARLGTAAPVLLYGAGAT